MSHPRTLDQWLDWQSTLNPAEIELGLERVWQVWNRLLPAKPDSIFISIAGTNGKGSSVAMLEAILKAAGYSTGSYTSPHILTYNERIRLDGIAVSDELICAAFERIEQARDALPLTYFEYGTLAALLICADAAVDVTLLEVGLGGRLDAVNIMDADIALVTSIALDHQDWLGSDRESIGREKAGIFRMGKPAVFSSDDPPESILDHARQLAAPLFVLNRDYQIIPETETRWSWQGADSSWQHLPMPSLPGEHQLRNAAGVLMVLECLSAQLPIRQSAIEQGLSHIQLQGRTQLLPGKVNWLLDVAHNPHAIQMLAERIAQMNIQGRVVAVLGMLNDKDAVGVFQIMQSLVDEWYLIDLNVPRSYAADELAQQFVQTTGNSESKQYTHIDDALAAAREVLVDGDLLLVFGSFYTVAGALRWSEKVISH